MVSHTNLENINLAIVIVKLISSAGKCRYCQSNVSPEMALRLSKGLGRSPESWLAMQDNYNLWHAKKTVNLDEIEPLAITA